MGANNRPVTTVTRSISFDADTFQMLEDRRVQLRMDRSEFLRAVLEDRLGIMAHPELGNPPSNFPSAYSAASAKVLGTIEKHKPKKAKP